jgi:hypothetical protein
MGGAHGYVAIAMGQNLLSKLVARASHRLDERMAAVFYLAPEPSNVYVHGPGSSEIVVAPDFEKQGFPREYQALIIGQKAERRSSEM